MVLSMASTAPRAAFDPSTAPAASSHRLTEWGRRATASASTPRAAAGVASRAPLGRHLALGCLQLLVLCPGDLVLLALGLGALLLLLLDHVLLGLLDREAVLPGDDGGVGGLALSLDVVLPSAHTDLPRPHSESVVPGG